VAGKEKVKEYQAEIENLKKKITENKQTIEDKKKKLQEINSQISRAMAEDKEARQKFFDLEKEVRGKQQELDLVRNKFNEIKIELARIEVREEDLISEVRQELGVEIESLEIDNVKNNSDESSNSENVTNFNREQLEEKINKLKREYEQVGGIDPMVIDEYKEMQERFDTLIEESKDLAKAIDSLKEVIKEMDKKIHQAFVGAYREISKEFTKYFRILFNGGNAKLSKIEVEKVVKNFTDEDDDFADDNFNLTGNEEKFNENGELVDENGELIKKQRTKKELGIEISATPPNKKVKHLSLLSGGERSLTSIAMLFAIIAYNPPPFIILDEVEAALDEANSRRLAKIFAELSSQTQFIIITHNRETMRHSEMLYGVTMGNDGISQILSVKLDQIGEEGEIR
jgi:chromosome segregation protein